MHGLSIRVLSLLFGFALMACAGPPSAGEETREAVEDLADEGDAEALTALGQMYEKGISVARDYALAHDLYRAASEEGDPLAPFLLGGLYARGLGVAEDYAKAAHWYELGAERGNPSAMAALARLYEQGKGVPRDYAKAVALYERAAGRWRESGEYPMDSAFATGAGEGVVLTPPGGAEEGAPASAAASAGSAANVPAEGEAPPVGCLASPPLGPAPANAIHLASFRRAENAAREWRRLCALAPTLVSDLFPRIVRVDLGEEGVYHRLVAGPFPSQDAARIRCRVLRSQGQLCAVLLEPGG